jgi:DNA repair protein RadD
MVVQNEIISHFIEQEYLDPMDDTVIDDLVEEFRRRGLDPEALGLSREDRRQRLIQARTRESLEPREMPVTSQRRPGKSCLSFPLSLNDRMKHPEAHRDERS